MTDRSLPDAETPSPPPKRPGLRLGRLFGVEVRIDWSLAIIFLLIVADLGWSVFPEWHPDWSAALVWGTAVGAAVLFFASVLAHELSHALVGRTQGIPVRRITLFLFGGMAHMEREPASPKAELLMAGVGPLVSLAIGAAGIVGAGLIAGSALDAQTLADPAAAMARLGPVATLLLWLGPVNVALGLFNLVPGFPLDGGRVLRAALWAGLKDLRRATLWASRAGRAFAALLMGFGVFSLFSGAWVQGLWLLLIGWFLMRAARQSYAQVVLREALREVPVGALMRRGSLGVSPELTLDALVREHFMQTDDATRLVVHDAALVGQVSTRQIHQVPAERWPTTRVRDVMTSVDALPTLSPPAGADRALELLARHDTEQLPVEEHDALVGVLHRRDLMRWLALQPEVSAA